MVSNISGLFSRRFVFYRGGVAGSSNLNIVQKKISGHFLTLFSRAILGQNLGRRAIFCFKELCRHPGPSFRVWAAKTDGAMSLAVLAKLLDTQTLSICQMEAQRLCYLLAVFFYNLDTLF